ncbi:hypothetical protein WKT22_04461 [Candidatus Lokiarchaeum ossiferum]
MMKRKRKLKVINMLTPEDMTYLDIAIHKSKISAFLNEVPKHRIHIAEFKEPKDKSAHHIRREHKINDDTEMIQHKINEIEESIIYYFQKLEIDPKKLSKPELDKRIFFEVTSVNNAIDILHEKATNEARRIRAYYNTLDKYEKELKLNKMLRQIYSWVATYSATKIAFEWFNLLEFRLFYMNSSEFVDMEVVLEHDELPIVLEYKEISDDITAFFMIYFKEHRQSINEICHGASELTDFKNHFDDFGVNLDTIDKEIHFAKERLIKANESIQKVKNEALRFRAYMELLENIKKYELIEIQFRESYGSEIVRMEAFIPTKNEEFICNSLDKKFHNYIRIAARVIKRDAISNEKHLTTSKLIGTDSEDYDYLTDRSDSDVSSSSIPSLIKPKKIFKPFQLLTRLYGTANYSELDPTSLVALTYPLLFGFMFGDIGHGLILCTVGLVLIFLNRSDKENSMYDAGFLFIWLGIAATGAGALYGEFFGFPLAYAEHLGFNPMHEIIPVLKIFVLVGVAHISLGWFLSMINFIQKKRVFLAIADPFLKILILIGGTIMIFTYMFEISAWVAPPYPILLPVIPTLLFVIVKPLGRIFGIKYLQKDSVGELFGEQALDLSETYLGIVSNVASYSRLLALSLVHMSLMLVFTTIADIILENEFFGDIVVVSIVLVIGNIFVIVLETLMAGIHALRLTFYEFFGKFFHADGVPYSFTTIDSDFSSIEFV